MFKVSNDETTKKYRKYDQLKAVVQKTEEEITSLKDIRREAVLKILSRLEEPASVNDLIDLVGSKDAKRWAATCLALFREKKLRRLKDDNKYLYYLKKK